ncbi:MAG: helix-turn-helix transcriptional regulator [bacterium]
MEKSSSMERIEILPEARFWTIKQLAAYLGSSTRHVRRQVELGRIPKPVRLGRRLMWDRQRIEEWSEQGCPQVEPSRTSRRPK